MTVNYVTMSGAEFLEAVGTDPDAWAEAYMQRLEHGYPIKPPDRPKLVEVLSDWFRDAFAAGARTALSEVFHREW